MKRLIVFTVAGLLAGFAWPAGSDAQMMQRGGTGQGMGKGMQGGMMGMMGEGMHQGCSMMGMMGKGMHGGFGFYLNLADRLDLTQAQIKQLRGLKFEFEKANIQRKAALQTARIELKQLKGADNVDVKKVEAKIRDIYTKQADQEVAVFQAQTKARQVLTPEQRTKLKALTGPRGGMMGGGMMGGGMMQQGKQGGGPSSHEQHHPN